MSSSIISSLNIAGKQITIYTGTLILIAGVVGGLLNIIVFLSLRTFRQSPCAFYLTIMSVFNVGQMFTGLLGRIMSSGFGIDWTQTSLFYCKFRLYCYQICSLISMTCICLATIDQYLTTCSRPRWQQWSNIKLAHRLVVTFTLIWIVHNTPYLIYYDQIRSITTGNITCIITNYIFQQYTVYGAILIIGRILPICITFFFGFLAYFNVKQLAHRTLPLVRRELDKQLTVTVLVQIIFAFFTIIPYSIVYLITMLPDITQDPLTIAQLQFALTFSSCLSYMYFASPFYINLCVSNRFRRQLIYVLFDIYLNRWQQRQIGVNPVIPHIQ